MHVTINVQMEKIFASVAASDLGPVQKSSALTDNGKRFCSINGLLVLDFAETRRVMPRLMDNNNSPACDKISSLPDYCHSIKLDLLPVFCSLQQQAKITYCYYQCRHLLIKIRNSEPITFSTGLHPGLRWSFVFLIAT